MKNLLLFIFISIFTKGFCSTSNTIDSIVNVINGTSPIKWEHNCVIKSIKFTGYTVSIKMDYNDENGDFFTKFRDNAHNNREEWIASLYKISQEWQQLFDQCVAESKTLTLLIYSTGSGAFSIKIFPEQIINMKLSHKSIREYKQQL